jgi:chromatin remodeling complex protein RSC6
MTTSNKTTRKRSKAPAKKTAKKTQVSAASSKRKEKKTRVPRPPPVDTTAACASAARQEPAKLQATRESVVEWFDKMVEDVKEEICRLKRDKQPGSKFLRTLNKNLKNVKAKTVRVMGKKPVKRSNTNSGFLKQVPISKEMAKFTGWEPKELKSRVDVTKFLCNYIKEHNLQNPEDRRVILPDSRLRKLLHIKSGDPPLTYYRIQSCIKPHFS